jgi:hypothetical protein
MRQVYNQVGQYGWQSLLEGATGSSPGSTYFVNGASGNAANTTDSGQGDSWDAPFSTLNYAISRCVSGAGDTIFVAAGHTETIQDTGTASGTTTDELVVDKAAVTIIGLGYGTRRPTFTLSGATDAAMVILTAASNVTVKNLLFVGGIADLAACITVAAGSDGCVIEDCEFRDGGTAILEVIHMISLAANADDVTIRGCKFLTTAAGSSTETAVNVVGAIARLTLEDNIAIGDWNTAVFENSAAAGANVVIRNNHLNNLDAVAGLCINLHASTSGVVIGNYLHGGLDGTSPLATTACLAGDNYYTNAEAASAAILTPATDS